LIRLPDMSEAQLAGWKQLLETEPVMPAQWVVIGGQMARALCAERGIEPHRETHDLDVLINVRAHPLLYQRFVTRLSSRGFEPDLPGSDGFQYRWRKGDVQIDVVQPRWLGERLRKKSQGDGRPAVDIPSAQQAINRAYTREIHLPDGTEGKVSLPSILGALVLKGAAWAEDSNEGNIRHLEDFAILATLVTGKQDLTNLSNRDIRHLNAGISGLRARPILVRQFAAGDTLNLMEATIKRQRRDRELGNNLVSSAPKTRCGHWMPRAKRACSRPSGHPGAHR